MSNVGNAPLPAEHGNRSIASGAAGRDAGEKAGIQSGLSEKSTFSATAVAQFGKPLHAMGQPAWDKTKSESMDRGHSFKNG